MDKEQNKKETKKTSEQVSKEVVTEKPTKQRKTTKKETTVKKETPVKKKTTVKKDAVVKKEKKTISPKETILETEVTLIPAEETSENILVEPVVEEVSPLKKEIVAEEINRTSERPLPRKKVRTTFHTAEVVVLVLITAFVTLIMGAIIFSNDDYEDTDLGSINDPEVREFLRNYQYILDNYYGEDIDKEELMKSAIKGMLSGLEDPNTGFIDQETDSTFNKKLQGTYRGVGVEIVNTIGSDSAPQQIYITRVFAGSPAEKAGLKALDIIKSVNGVDMTGKATSEFTKIITDAKDQKFKLVVLRGEEEVTVEVESEIVSIQSVMSQTYEKNGKKIGYLSVEIFAANTYEQFKVALEALEKTGIDSLIIDLRGNTGGHLSVVKNMLSLFLDSSHVIYQTETKDKTEKIYSTGSQNKTYPIVVLTDKTSASASEIMASALKEQSGASLVGIETYGKGTVQELRELENGDQYKFTTKKWLTSKGTWIHGTGIKPDYEVSLGMEYYQNPSDETDTQLQKAFEVLTK